MRLPPLTALTQADRPQVGGKAAHLGELAAMKLRVPPGFVVPAEAGAEFMEGMESAAAILEKSVPASLAASLREMIREMGLERVSVRSSATVEDSSSASFAGVFDSFMNVAPSRIEGAVKKCWLSARSTRAADYCKRYGLNPGAIRMAVIVQRFIIPSVSGVCFTANPVTGNPDEMVIEAALGLGEGLVSGLVTPDTYTIDSLADRISHRSIGIQDRMYVSDSEGIWPVAVDERIGSAAKLTDAQIREVAASCRAIASHYKYPQDVEFALENGTLFFLQARPITTMQGRTQ